ncbi:2'-5' RNA ligase family protein [Actinoplanes sp. LDG1-06]|uniref:2'-5' RNA ligase family protein n=1 Tax=Paractinoplanes ovalisporus TaxID=2810368 RepID=A0ABS2A8L6_9ACTN|nr:2'-5' RNA ligase family protein [Actinoplanes ovalisporus]MBM2616181.1 2'-5' RNA ligase family protein [Actinoplanes ovalisporus]
MEPTHSALIVAVAEAEPYVAAHRDRLDAAASWGVPAHITVLYPFLAPAEIDEHVLAGLRHAAAGVPAFFCDLAAVKWFGERVVWLAPEPAGPFQALTGAVTARFPQVRPYEGAFDDVVPHLTIGHDHPPAELKAAADDVAAHLPVPVRVTSMRLAVGRPVPGRSWTTLEEFALG